MMKDIFMCLQIGQDVDHIFLLQNQIKSLKLPQRDSC